jgi:nucleoid DNA-binding protein
MNLYDERKDRIATHKMIIEKVAELTGEEASLVEAIVLQEQVAISELLEEKLDMELTHFGSFKVQGRLATIDKDRRRVAFLKRKEREKGR